jgi:hypothetical protein
MEVVVVVLVATMVALLCLLWLARGKMSHTSAFACIIYVLIIQTIVVVVLLVYGVNILEPFW